MLADGAVQGHPGLPSARPVVSPGIGRVCAAHCGAPLSEWGLECLYQPEVYPPLQAHGGRQFADLYISPPESMLLEATRDGKDLTQHLNRFLDPRKYGPLLQSGAVKQHAVIDFCSPGSAAPRVQDQHLYNVVFRPAFAEAVIYHMGEQQTVQVAGRADDATQSALTAALQS